MTRRRKGFTLIELLVVIAIIGILAAMIFPVFARARDAARKAVCLSNMKNINLALQMYLQDNDMTTPPNEHRREVAEWFAAARGRSATYPWPTICNHVRQANPYIRWPVVLDPYVKNRAMWQCPAAKTLAGAGTIVGWPNWWAWWQSFSALNTNWPVAPCSPALAWPRGWGGDITDSKAQGYVIAIGLQQGAVAQFGRGGPAKGVFVSTIVPEDWPELDVDNMVDDPSWFVLISDGGAGRVTNWNATSTLWPEACFLNTCGSSDPCCAADPDNCPWTSNCGISWAQKEADDGPLFSALARERYTRHMGGVNLGFADGHVKWLKSEEVLSMLPNDATGVYECAHDSLGAALGCVPVF